MSKKDMVKRRIQIIDELSEELKELRSHKKDILENDDDYEEIKEKAKLVKDQEKAKKQQVLDDPSYQAIMDQMKEIRAEIRDQKDVLSQELLELYEEEGLTEIEDQNGNWKKLKFNVKLVNA